MGAPLLIVDDNPVNRKLVTVSLEGAGYEIHTAGNAAEALDLVARFHPRLILMDLLLPDVDGMELTRRLKSDPATKDIIVLALTASARNGSEQRALAAGCDGFLTKPIEPERLATLVARSLAGAVATEDRTAPDDPASDIANRLRAIVDGFGPKVLHEIIQLFGTTAEECLTGLRRAASDQDGPALVWFAHRLAGSGASIGARTVTDLCHELQHVGTRGTPFAATDLIDRLAQALDAVQAALDAHGP